LVHYTIQNIMSTEEHYIEYERGTENVGENQVVIPLTHRTDIEIAWEMYNEGEINETNWTQYFTHYVWEEETNANWWETPEEPAKDNLLPTVETNSDAQPK